jgi:uncharacterized membrane protein
MTNSHDFWDEAGERARRRRVLVVLSLLTVFAILVGTTIVGVVANWPKHRHVPTPALLRHPKTFEAKVTALRSTRCLAPSAHNCLIVTARLESGPDKNKETSFRFGDSGGAATPSVGNTLLVYRNPLPPGARLIGQKISPYQFVDFQRRAPLLWLAIAFAVITIAAGRLHGLRALVGLVASLATIVFFVVPAIDQGRPPLQVVAFGGLGVMLLTIPLVHGGGAKSLAACLGTALALLVTLGLADAFTSLAHLSGLTTDQAIYLQATTHVSIRGLLLAGMVIGSLGVLSDTTVTQASTVITLRRVDPTLSWRQLVSHATSVGRDHIAATVNTLVLAYTGAALPLLVIFGLGDTSLTGAINTEPIAEPIVATLVGSIGLVSAVPLTTALAALLALHLPERQLRNAAHSHAH